MTTTFLKNWFSGKNSNSKNKEPDMVNTEDSPPIPPERRLTLSKSGKMKRKTYNRQISVKDAEVFTQQFVENDKNSDSVTNSENQQDNIEDVLADMLKTVENTKI